MSPESRRCDPPTGARMRVATGPGKYLVSEACAAGVRVYEVGKDRACSCGRGGAERECRHVEAVEEYLRAGGERAPRLLDEEPAQTPVAQIPDACPICGAGVRIVDLGGARPVWRCAEDGSHYWQWRGERFGVKAFLTRPQRNKVVNWRTPEQRATFLARARRRMAGYAPCP